MNTLPEYTIQDLGYYIRNKELALVHSTGESPQIDEAEGIVVEYTTVDFTNIIDEESDVPLTPFEKRAVVAYLKMKYFDALGDMNRKQFYEAEFNRFKNKVVQAYNPKPRRFVHTGPTALK
jgi:hypothetical protein